MERAIAENTAELISNFLMMREHWNLMSDDEIEEDAQLSWWETVKEKCIDLACEFEEIYDDNYGYVNQMAEFSERELKKAFGRKSAEYKLAESIYDSVKVRGWDIRNRDETIQNIETQLKKIDHDELWNCLELLFVKEG